MVDGRSRVEITTVDVPGREIKEYREKLGTRARQDLVDSGEEDVGAWAMAHSGRNTDD
jgi:hypothetical protein